MDATHRMVCRDDLFNPLTSMGLQLSCILVISHFFHLVLKALGQPGPIAQIFAGMVLGPSALSNFKPVKGFFFQTTAADFYQVFGLFCRIIFMFLIGLETDVPYAIRNIRNATIIAYGGALLGFAFGLGSSFFLQHQLEVDDHFKSPYVFTLMLILSYTASPVVIRLAGELKFDTSDVGRLAIVSSLIVEMTCLLLFNFMLACHSGKLFKYGFYCFFLSILVMVINKYLSNWFNKRNHTQKYLKNTEVFVILSFVIGSAMFMEWANYNSIMNCFVIGLMFPREGKTARTLSHKLTYSVHNFILPIYFGYIGFQFNGTFMNNWRNVLIVLILVLLSIGSKIGGTLAACRYLKIPLNDGVLIGFILNLKGHADILFIGSASKLLIVWSPKAYNLLLISVVLNTLISGPVVAFLLRREEVLFGNMRTALEIHDPSEELRMLACVFGPRQVSPILGLISGLSGCQTAPTTPYLMHLIELLQKRRTKVSYHEKEQHELSDDEDYGGNDVIGIHEAVDTFTAETGIFIHVGKTVSTFTSLYEDVCNIAEDLRVSIILLPFHKHQRIDGKMDNGKEGIRTTNHKVLRHAPCSVGIIVNRGTEGVPGFSQLLGSESIQQVATLFFGGPDDREAVAWSRRIAAHPRVNLTVIRFQLPASLSSSSSVHNSQTDNASDEDDGMLMALSRLETGNGRNEVDNSFLTDFYNRYVTSGQVGYVEKSVNNATETVAALRDIGDMYSLFIVGKGGRGHSPLTTGICDWEECPELGTVGDLLASSDININGSVLIIQQHRQLKKDLLGD